ncbi:hypothetical protein [Deinococcus navajonensis]|uniref:Ig-like domain-containing protein n=1 Tax=Deinococcus navajonensis TaxID=309884 RepID=A0ABV8XLU0_9DEIO
MTRDRFHPLQGWRACHAVLTVAAVCLVAPPTAQAGGGGAPPTAAQPPRTSAALQVTTTMAGFRQKNLPPAMQWDARANVPDANIEKVQFFIDGHLSSTPRDAPYVYGGRSNAGAAGRFVSTWLKPGPHTFTTTITTRDGRTASETVVANVVAPPAPVAALAGGWERVVTTADQERALKGRTVAPEEWLPEKVLNKSWFIIFDEAGMWVLDPFPSGVMEHVTVQGNRLNTLGGARMAVDGIPITAYGKPISPYLCVQGQDGAYTWSVTGDTLTLKSITPGCMARQAILEGTWTRMKTVPPRNLTFER